MRDKVIGKKWIYLERYTFHRQNVVCLKKQEQPQGMGSSQKVRAAKGETRCTGRVWAISEGERPQNMGWLVFLFCFFLTDITFPLLHIKLYKSHKREVLQSHFQHWLRFS